MRTIKYKVLAPVGPWVTRRVGSLADLVLEMFPYEIRVFHVMPPFNLLNEMLQRGKVDRGMSGGCEWRPLAITQEEYEQVFRELQSSYGLSQETARRSVTTYEAWFAWLLEQQTWKGDHG